MREANRNGKAQTFITKIDIVQHLIKASMGIYTMLKVCVVGSRRKTYTILLYQTYRMATLKPAERWLFIV